MVLGKVVKPLPPPPLSELPPVQRLAAATYAEIADKTLFSRDRNSIITQVAPPEKIMPPLPLLHGVVDVGDGPVALLLMKAGGQDKGFRPGDKVGDFKLVSVTASEIVFDWDGKAIEKKLEEIMDRSATQAATADTTPRPAAPAAPPPPPASGRPEPGVSMGGDLKACQAGDNSPAGTVADGMRKVISATPFGSTCRWEPVK
jgi:hypothetical protein